MIVVITHSDTKRRVAFRAVEIRTVEEQEDGSARVETYRNADGLISTSEPFADVLLTWKQGLEGG